MAPQAKKAGSPTKPHGAAFAPAASAGAASASAGAGAGKRKRGRGRGNRKRGGRRAAAASSSSSSDSDSSEEDSDDESSEAGSDRAEPVASTSKTASTAATTATTKSTSAAAAGAPTAKSKSDKKGKGRASDDEPSGSDDDSDDGSSSDASSSSFLTTSSEEEADEEDDAAPSQTQSAQSGHGALTNATSQTTLAGGDATRRPEMTRPPSPPYIQFGADADLAHNVRAFGKPILWGLLPGDADAPSSNMSSAELARIEDEKKAASERYTRFRDHYVTRMVSCFGGALDSVRQKEAETMTPNRLEVLIASIGAGADLFTSQDAAKQGIWRTKDGERGERELVIESLDTVTERSGQSGPEAAVEAAHDEEMQL